MSLEGCRSPSFPAAEERTSFFPAGRDAILIIGFWDFRLRKILFVIANIRIKLYRRYSSQPPLLPVQIVQNWQGTDSLACDKLEPARRAGIQLVRVNTAVTELQMFTHHAR